MRVGAFIVAAIVTAALIWWASLEDAATRRGHAVSESSPTSAAMAPAISDEPRGSPVTAGYLFRRSPPGPIPPERIVRDVVLSAGELAERDFAAFRLIMKGLKGNRPAIEQCVFDLENAVQSPTVFEWSLVLDVTTEDGVARVHAVSDQWPDAMPSESRECFATAFTGVEFDTHEERFSYRLAYDMSVSVAPPPS